MKTDLSKYNNDWFAPTIGASKPKQLLWYFVNVVFFMNPLFPFSRIKTFILRWFGAKVGKGIVIKPNVNIKYPWKLTIGNHVWIGEGVWIDNLCEVKIGNDVCLSQGAMLLTGNHDYKKVSFDLIVKTITLEDGVWIGTKSVVCPGVIAHTHSILTVNSVATRSLEAYTIYQGNPAIPVRKREIVA